MEKPPVQPRPGKRILVAGAEESECHSLVGMVLKANRRFFPRKLVFARLPSLEGRDFEAQRQAFSGAFRRLLERDGHVVLSGPLAPRTKLGFTPLFTSELASRFRPDLTVLLEMDTRDAVIVPGYGIVKRRIDLREVRIQQELNRSYASMLFGTVRILPIERGNVKQSLRDLKQLLLAGLKE